MSTLTFIDLFAGAGGLSEGFVRAGYEAIAHVEMDRDACNTLRTRAAYHYLRSQGKMDIYEKYLLEKRVGEDGRKLWSKVPSSVVGTVIEEAIGNDTLQSIFHRVDGLLGDKALDLIIGGPPCQAYSVVGRARVGKERVEQDVRNELYKFYIKFLERYHPRMFVFENVHGILSACKGSIMSDLENLAHRSGYQMKHSIQNASEVGVLQNRMRVIIVGWRTDNAGALHYPELTHEPTKYAVMRDLFSDLPERKAGEGDLFEPVYYTRDLSEMPYLVQSGIRGSMNFTTQHVARPHNLNDRKIYVIALKKFYEKRQQLSYDELPVELQTHRNKLSFLNRYSVVNPWGCSHTVVAHISCDGHYYIYPTPQPDVDHVRSITVREAARLQSFPDDFFFEGSRTSAFKQIGNAVPVVLAYRIADALKCQLL